MTWKGQAMHWTHRTNVLVALSFVLSIAPGAAAQPAPLVEMRAAEISVPVTAKHPASWTASPVTYPNARELVVVRQERIWAEGKDTPRDVYAARMLITSEPRKSHANALQRLLEIAIERRGSASFVAIGGWPAVEVGFVDRAVTRGEATASSRFATHAITAIAAGDRVVRFATTLRSGTDLALLGDAVAIARSATFPTQAAAATLKVNLEALNRKLRERRRSQGMSAAPPAPPPVPSKSMTIQSQPDQVHAVPVPNIGWGEIEVAVSADANAVVVASIGKVAFSTDRAATFSASNHGLFQPKDPTVTRGASGHFYLGTLANANGSAAHLGERGCMNAVSRSTDGGATFSLNGYSAKCPESGTDACFPDQPHLAADTITTVGGNDQVYAVWRQLLPEIAEPTTQCRDVIITENRRPMMSCSQDSGVTWTTAQPIYDMTDFPRVAVARDGSVFVVLLSGDVVLLFRFTSCASGLTLMPGYPVNVTTLSGQVACPVPGLDRCNNGNTLTSPTVATDPGDANHVFVGFAERDPLGGERIVVVESRDGGATFPMAQRATISEATPARRFMPWVCSTRGNAYGGWYDRRAALEFGARIDLTDYFLGGALSVGGGSPSLTPLAERNLTNSPDPHCAWWRCAPRSADDSESCVGLQPQQAGLCMASPTDTPTAATPRCDFSDQNCASGLACQTRGGCPKYGDYNGIACADNWVVAAWFSGTAPSGLPAASGPAVYAAAEYVGPLVLEPCKTNPKACVAPVGLAKDAIRVKCLVLPCLVIDPLPRNCLVKWTCPGCPPGMRCPPFYHIVFDDTLARWNVHLVDGHGRLVSHQLKRVGRRTVMTVRPTEAAVQGAQIADYRLVFTARPGTVPGVEYTIRARLEVTDGPVLDLQRIAR
jgi:hypothetical protein